MNEGIQEGGVIPPYSYQVFNQLFNEANAFSALPKEAMKMFCPNCKNVEMTLHGARGGNTNQTTEIWLCPQCNQITYNNTYVTVTFPYVNTSSGSGSGYTINIPPQYQPIIMPDEIKQPVEIPIECPVCNDLFSNHKEYDEHIENEHKWMLGGTVHEEDEEEKNDY